MAVDEAPFDDLRVRQAFRLIADRQALIDGALSGFGTLGNDLAGSGLPYYADLAAPRAGPRAGARSLLAEAGQENLEVTLHTSDIVPGFVEAATLFAEQAKRRGRHGQRQEGGRERLLRHVAALHEARLRPVVLDVLPRSGLVRRRRCSRTRSGTRRTGGTRRSTSSSARRSGATDEATAHGALGPGAADPVRRGRLHRLGEPEHRRRRREQRAGHRRRARSSTSAAGTTGTSGSTSRDTRRAACRSRDDCGAAAPAMTTSVAVACSPHRLASLRSRRSRRSSPGSSRCSSSRSSSSPAPSCFPATPASAVLGRNGDARAARRAARAHGSRPARGRALLRLARRAAHRRSRQLGGRLRAGRRDRDLGRDPRTALELVHPRGDHAAAHVPLSLFLGVRSRRVRAGRAARPRDLADARSRSSRCPSSSSARCSSWSSSRGSTCCRRSR